jgi:hypothetical protein
VRRGGGLALLLGAPAAAAGIALSQNGSAPRPAARAYQPPVSAHRIGPVNAAALRKTYESELEAAILADAQLLVRVHFLRGPILGVTCTPMERGGQPVAANTARFNCLAIKRRIDHTLEGARYFGAIDFATGSHTYRGD